jgi:hypothetical protein
MGRKNKPIESDDDDEPQVSSVKGKTSEKGLNYAAIALMLLFGLPVLLAVVVQVKTFRIYLVCHLSLKF